MSEQGGRPEDELARLLRRFVSGEDRSGNAARQLEGLVATAFPEDVRFEDILDALASYEPGGGPYLFDEQTMLPKCEHALRLLEVDTWQA